MYFIYLNTNLNKCRFIYWRVCCYVCTRAAKRPRRSRQRSMRSHRYSSRSQPPPFRRSMKLSNRSANDSGIGMQHAYSDPELRTVGRDYDRDFDYDRQYSMPRGRRHQYAARPPATPRASHNRGGSYMDHRFHDQRDEGNYGTQTLNRGASRFSSRQRNRDRMHDRHTVERERNIGRRHHEIDDMDHFEMPPPAAKRALSVRSMRSPSQARVNLTFFLDIFCIITCFFIYDIGFTTKQSQFSS